MKKLKKSSISKATSYEAIGEFWDTHDVTKYHAKTKPAEFKINLQYDLEVRHLKKTPPVSQGCFGS